MFYLLSLVTGVLECGWIAFGAVHSLPLWQILCYPLAYHIGNLFPKPFSLSKTVLTGMVLFSALISAVSSVMTLSSDTVFVLTCISLTCLSAAIQSVRSISKSDGNRLVKRVFRVGGFLIAPLAAVAPREILIGAAVLALYSLRSYVGSSGACRMIGQGGYSVVMVFHQLHYFFYAHITLAAMSLMFVRDLRSGALLGTLLGALLFCGTWVTYMSVEPIVSKLTTKILPVFYAGHIGIGVLLFTMSLVTNSMLFIVLWIATGFGGGVVYTISARARQVGCYNMDSMIISENIGHTLGLLSAAVTALVSDGRSPGIMLVSGAVSAVLAVIAMTLTTRKENRHEDIHDQS